MKSIDILFVKLQNKDNKLRFDAFQTLLQMTENNVEWVYDKWYDLIEKLNSENSFQRSIGLMLLANLSKSDTDNKICEIIEDYLRYFNDEKFITSRQCIQNVWKIAVSKEFCRNKILDELKRTYYENIHINKHGNLIKQDVISSMFQIYRRLQVKEILTRINELINSENDEKLITELKKSMKNNKT